MERTIKLINFHDPHMHVLKNDDETYTFIFDGAEMEDSGKHRKAEIRLKHVRHEDMEIILL